MATSIFSSLPIYGDKWQVKSERMFSQAEKNEVTSAEVTEYQGEDYTTLSVCFHMKAGGCAYIPVSSNVETAVGEIVDVNKCKLVTLGRNGSSDITRVEW